VHEVQESRIASLARKPGGVPILCSGLDGVGKLKLCRSIGGRLLCGRGGEEDGRCDCIQCVSYAESTHPDYGEFRPVDGVFTVDAVRDFLDFSMTVPIQADRKVAVLCEIDRMHVRSGDFLLKVIEEVPDHLTVLMTSGNLEGVSDTVRSRSFLVEFGLLIDAEVLELLREEGIGESEELLRFASGSVASVRDSDITISSSILGALDNIRGASSSSYTAIAQWADKLSSCSRKDLIHAGRFVIRSLVERLGYDSDTPGGAELLKMALDWLVRLRLGGNVKLQTMAFLINSLEVSRTSSHDIQAVP